MGMAGPMPVSAGLVLVDSVRRPGPCRRALIHCVRAIATRSIGIPLGAAAIVLALLLPVQTVRAQGTASPERSYPAKPVRIVVTFTTGGSADFTARLLAERLSGLWGQQVVVENRIGAGGNIGADLIAKSAPDGYSLLLGSNTLAFNAALYPKLPFDIARDFTMLGYLTASPNVLAVNPSVPATNLAEFTALLRSHPGKYDYATCGVATAQHYAMELYKFLTGVHALHIPYRGCSAAAVDAVSGQVDIVIASVTVILPHTRAGRLRAIAVTSRDRSPSVPEVPSFRESGIAALRDYGASVSYGLMAPAGTPPEILRKVEHDVATVMADPDVRRRLTTAGLDITPSSPAQMSEDMLGDVAHFRKVIEFAGIRPE